MARQPYSQRLHEFNHPLAVKLVQLVLDKQSNLAAAADFIYSDQILTFADQVGPAICILKTHCDMVVDFSPKLIEDLQALADKHGFFLFEDRKFADIGEVVKAQYTQGVFQIAQWAHIINAHSLSGPGIIEALRAGRVSDEAACLLIAEMSSQGNLYTPEYKEATRQIAERYPDFVMGYITQRPVHQSPHQLHITPGARMDSKRDSRDQQYLTPEVVIGKHHADIMIVGRGLSQAEDPITASQLYQQAGWHAYLQSLQTQTSYNR